MNNCTDIRSVGVSIGANDQGGKVSREQENTIRFHVLFFLAISTILQLGSNQSVIFFKVSPHGLVTSAPITITVSFYTADLI